MENGQAGMGSIDQLDRCCRLVSELFGKPDIHSWTNGDYVKLGYILFKKTTVQISPNTLKRIFGKIKTDHRYYPQRATRDALARYAGFADWEAFALADAKAQIADPKMVIAVPHEPETPAIHRPPTTVKRPWQRRAVAGLLALFAISFVAYRLLQRSSNDFPKVTLRCNNPVGENPHSAAFVVSGLPGQFSNRYTIDFGDSKKIAVSPGDSLYSHYYEVPWRYQAILKRDGMPIDTAVVFLKTNAWTATAQMMYDTTRVYPIEVSDLFTNSRKQISIQEVSRAGIDTNRTFFVKFINTQPTDLDGDNFDLDVKLKTSHTRPGVRCSQVRVTVFGEKSNHFVDVMKPGCEHWTDLQFSEVAKPGELNQLDFLGVDMVNGGTIGLHVADKRAQVLINDKQVYQTDYKKPLAKIYGLSITFSGIGSVESVQLKDRVTGKMFAGNF